MRKSPGPSVRRPGVGCLDAVLRGRTAPMTRTKRLVFTLITACLSLMLSFVVCEFVARVLAPQWLQERMAALRAANADPGAFGSDRGWKVERRNGAFVSFSPRQHFDVWHVEYHNVANIDALGGR